jgi:hypothetical protein
MGGEVVMSEDGPKYGAGLAQAGRNPWGVVFCR